MAEKIKKQTSVGIKRKGDASTKVIVATGFRIRPDRQVGMIEVSFQTSSPRGDKVLLDPILMAANLEPLTKYAASLEISEDDSAEKDEISVGDSVGFANVIYFSQMGFRAETTFARFSIHDYVEATRHTAPEIFSMDALVVVSTIMFQKKLLLELLTLMTQTDQASKK